MAGMEPQTETGVTSMMMTLFTALFVSGLSAHASLAQSPRGTAALTLKGTTMTIEYGRPPLEGRDVLGKAPKGYVWRLGADRATTLSLTGPAVFGNMVVAKGEYSLFVERISEDRWSLVVNQQIGPWGTEIDRNKDLIGVPLKWEKQETATEQLTIELAQETAETGILSIRWGKDVLKQRFRLAPPS
jgi:hypothetical protein